MKVLITGAAGMIGRKLFARLQSGGEIAGKQISAFFLQDVAGLDADDSTSPIHCFQNDIANYDIAKQLISNRPDVIFHLASVVSVEAETDFDKGYRTNLDGTRNLLEAVRAEPEYYPRIVYTSSIAVFGAPFPSVIDDDFAPVPLSSYGVQKLIGEHLLNDYSRRGFVDGIGLRLPTVCVRPGKPNAAASGFFSSIIREPLVGQKAYIPVSRSLVHNHVSPRATTGFLMHAASLDNSKLGNRRTLCMPGVAVSVSEQVEALARVAGNKATRLIEDRPDNAVSAIVENWPQRFNAARALAFGFKADNSFDDIIKAHIEDELSA